MTNTEALERCKSKLRSLGYTPGKEFCERTYVSIGSTERVPMDIDGRKKSTRTAAYVSAWRVGNKWKAEFNLFGVETWIDNPRSESKREDGR